MPLESGQPEDRGKRTVARGSFQVAGVRVDAVPFRAIQPGLRELISEEGTASVFCCNVNMVVQANREPHVREAVESANLVLPDGRPIAAIGKRRSDVPVDRVRGTDLLRLVCASSTFEDVSHFFYGGGEGVAAAVAEELKRETPSLRVAGTRSPPFGEVSELETEEEISAVNDADPDVVWVGLGCPKQELWIHRNRDRLDTSLIIGVGAAFDFIAETKPEAPEGIADNFEFLWRLITDPSGAWRRVFIEGPIFGYLLIRERTGPSGGGVRNEPR